jgi:hypothetical protein
MIQTLSPGYNPRNAEAGVTACVTGTLQWRIPHRSHPKVTLTSDEVTVTSAVLGKIEWQAGMSRIISDVRGYVRPRVMELHESRGFPKEKAGKSEKHALQAGMYKGMNSLAGYVDRDGREN